MTGRSWLAVLLVFLAVFLAIAHFSVRRSDRDQSDPPADPGTTSGGRTLPPRRLDIPAFRPRILFSQRTIRAEGGLRERVAGDGRLAEAFAYVQSWAADYVKHPTPTADLPPEIANVRLRALALCHLALEDDQVFGRAAVQLLDEALADPARRKPGFDWVEFGVTEALVFDWCSDVLDAGERARLSQDMLKRGDYVADIKNAAPPKALDAFTELQPLAYLGLALAGEEEADSAARGWLALVRERFFLNILKPRNAAARDGAAFALGDHEPEDEVRIARLLRVWRLATDEDFLGLLAADGVAADVYPANVLPGWLASMAPDGSGDKYAGNHVRNPVAPPELFYEIASLGQDIGRADAGVACAKGDEIFRRRWEALGDDSAARLTAALERILSDNYRSEIPTVPGAGGPEPFTVFEKTGLAYLRTTPEDGVPVWIAFRASAPPAGRHLHQNHVGLARGKDHLGVDAGFPSPPSSDHIVHYMSTPYAHNTVVLDDPSSRGGASGKRFTGYSRGRLAWAHRDAFVSAFCGRVTITSEDNKAEFLRAVVLLPGGHLLIFDTILVHRAAAVATWLWHTQSEIELDGMSVLLEGKRAGGIVESTDSAQFSVTEGDSRLIVRTIYPRSAVMRVVGGDRYEFRSADLNHPVSTSGEEIAREELRRQRAGRYRVEVEAPRPGRRMTFVHVAACGEKESVRLPEITLPEDSRTAAFTLTDDKRAIQITLEGSSGRLRVVVRDAAIAKTLYSHLLGE